MLTIRKQVGNDGENIAAKFLESCGYRIVARQAGIPRVGEIDLIASDGGTLVFVEVKTRYDAKYGPPEEAITYRKLRRMMLVAETWRTRNHAYERPWRVDVVAIEMAWPKPVIRHIKDVHL